MDQAKTCEYIIKLIRALLTETDPPELPEGISFEDVYKMAKKHHIRNMCLYAIEKLQNQPDEELLVKWNKQRAISSAQSAVQLSERDRIIHAFSENGIDCLPLKGCLLKEMYPKPEYREMADLDILIRREDEKKVRELMESIGYKTGKYHAPIHDIYVKDPFVHVEMHMSLLDEERIKRFETIDKSIKLLRDPWKYAIPTDLPHIYSFSWEDFYLFLIIHLAKHYYSSGTGIRQMTDILIFHQKHTIDREMVYQTLRKTSLYDFCKNAEQLVDAWYEEKPLSPELTEMQDYVFSSGVYGTQSNGVSHWIEQFENKYDSEKKAHFMYAFNRIFPSPKVMQNIYPILKQYPVFLPGAWVYRWIQRSTQSSSRVRNEIKIFINRLKGKR